MSHPGSRGRATPSAGPDQTGGRGRSNLAEGYRSAGPYIGAVWALVGSVALFTFGGHWLDGRIGDRIPWFTLLGAALGMVGGFISFFRAVLGRRSSR
jgi:ATP synthase protein I